MAAPKRLAGGPPQVSLHLKASEPSVRRAAVPFSKPNRPFGSNGGPMVAAPVENFIPRTPAPAPKVEPVETPVIEPVADLMPESEKPAVEDFESETVSEPISEVAEFSSVSEPHIIDEPVGE